MDRYFVDILYGYSLRCGETHRFGFTFLTKSEHKNATNPHK